MNRITLILGGIVAVGIAYGVGDWSGYARGVAAEKARNDAALIVVERENLRTQQLLIRKMERLAEDAEQERRQIEDRLAAADDAVDILQRAVRDANASDDPSPTADADAATARSLLAACAARYRDVAAEADRLRAIVIGLQAYARDIASDQ